MTRQLWRTVNGRAALEFVAGPISRRAMRAMPEWRRALWWLVAFTVFVAMACKFVGE